MALSALPHMSHDDLELFLRESAAQGELQPTPSEMDACRLRRRRMSVEQKSDEEVRHAVLRGGLTEGMLHGHRAKVVILGDDTQAKVELCGLMLFGKGGARRTLEVVTRTVKLDGDSGASCEADVWVPHVSSLHAALRAEQLHGTHCFIVAYSIRDRRSFDNARAKWAAEVAEHCAALREAGAPDALCDPPLVLVGTDAEVRNAQVGRHSIAVPSGEAVQAAQELGAAKYMECYSGNEHHAKEVLHQALEALAATRGERGCDYTRVNRDHAVQSAIFAEHNAVPAPRGTFDLVARTLTIAAEPDAACYYTLDGSDPATSSTAQTYTRPIEFSRPMPRCVRVMGRGRCRLPSEGVEFAVPQETPPPMGFFDVNHKTFVARAPELPAGVDAVQIRYTLDGSDPKARSPTYTAPLHFDGPGATPGGAWADAKAAPPRVIRLVAIGAGMFCSRVVAFEPPALLPEPRVQYNATDGTFVVDASPTVECRYTLDGSAPTTASTLYVRPVMLPLDGASSVRMIRVAAFPKPAFPSREVVVDVRHNAHRDPHQRTIHTTRTAMARGQAALAKRLDHEATKTPIRVAPGSRTASPIVSSRRTNGAAASPQRIVGSAGNGGGGNTTIDTTTRRRQAMTGAASPQQQQAQQSGHHAASAAVTPARRVATRTPPPPPPPPQQQPRAAAGNAERDNGANGSGSSATAGCEAHGNCVDFRFDDPIALSHITVATPGGGGGPSSYEVRVQHRDSGGGLMVVGSGELEDLDGVQTLHVIPSARVVPVVRVQCAFNTAHGGPFEVNDMQVHGKPHLS